MSEELTPVVKGAAVVLDTNAITERGWYLGGPNFGTLKMFLRQTGSRLVVPEIVVMECVNNFQRKVEDLATQATDAIRTLRELMRGAGPAAMPPVDVKAATDAYKTTLLGRLTTTKLRSSATRECLTVAWYNALLTEGDRSMHRATNTAMLCSGKCCSATLHEKRARSS